MAASTQGDYERGPEAGVEHGSGSSRRKRLFIPLALVALLAVAGGITAWQVTKDRSTTRSDGAFAKRPQTLETSLVKHIGAPLPLTPSSLLVQA